MDADNLHVSPRPSNLSVFAQSAVAAVLGGEHFGTATLPSDEEEERVIPGSLIRALMNGTYGPLAEPAIHIHGILIDGDVDLTYSDWRGELDVSHCRIKGNFAIAHAAIRGRVCLDGSAINALSADYAFIDGPLLFRHGFCSQGLHGIGMKVSGALNLRETEVRAPKDRMDRCAIELYRAHLGDIFLLRTRIYGGIYGNGITIDRNLRLQGATIVSREAMNWATGPESGIGAVMLVGATIGSALYLSWKDPGRQPWNIGVF